MKQYYTIPVFIPELACPHRCVFCNQHSITSVLQTPSLEEVQEIIERYVATIPAGKTVDIGFLGGNFTGIAPEEQEAYLKTAQPYLESDKIGGIRISTRPDYITTDILSLLKRYGVTTIELGAQTMDDAVLQNAGRGHTVANTERAAAMIKEAGFSLGLQMMTGLPGDTDSGAIDTARRIIALGASSTRIYPTLVVKGTYLEKLWREGEYIPQTLEEAVTLLASIIPLFEESGVDILRTGLHPTEGFISGDDLLDGPFHPSLKTMALSRIWRNKLKEIISRQGFTAIEVVVNPADIPHAVGHQSQNKRWLQRHFRNVHFVQHHKIEKGAYDVNYR